MKYTRQMLLAAALMVTPMLATAQFGQTVCISTQVAFEFVVGYRVVPAGKCVLQAAHAAADTILIRNDGNMARLSSSASLGDDGTEVPPQTSPARTHFEVFVLSPLFRVLLRGLGVPLVFYFIPLADALRPPPFRLLCPVRVGVVLRVLY